MAAVKRCGIGACGAALHYYPPGLVQDEHEHNSAHMSVLLAGSLREAAHRNMFDVDGTLLRVREDGFRHSVKFGLQGALVLSVPVASEDVFEMNAWTAAWSRPERPNAFRNVLRGLFVDAAPYGSIALDLLVSAKPHAPLRTQPEWLLQARERVIEESSPMMINEIAVEAGVHRVHLARMFVASFGAPPSVIRRRAMLARAVTAIVTGKTSLANAAAASGFSDHAHMARTFREFLGVSPSTLRDVFR